MALIRAAVGYGTTIRTLTVTASGLVPPGETEEQLDIFNLTPEQPSKKEAVEDALHEIRKKLGKNSITLGLYENPEIGTGKSRSGHE